MVNFVLSENCIVEGKFKSVEINSNGSQDLLNKALACLRTKKCKIIHLLINGDDTEIVNGIFKLNIKVKK